MAETKIDISDFKHEGSDLVKDLTKFLEEKTGRKPEAGTDEITIEEKKDEEAISRGYVRVLLRKFLHQKELKDYYRVIGEKDNVLRIKEKKTAEEE